MTDETPKVPGAQAPEETGGKTDEASFAHSLQPLRGILSTHNRRGALYSPTSLKKWVALSAGFFQASKADVRVRPETLGCLPELLAYAATKDFRLSLRTTGDGPLDALDALQEQGLLDVCLSTFPSGMAALAPWVESCARLSLPLRILLHFPDPKAFSVEETLGLLEGAAAVHLSAYDFFDARETAPAARPAEALEEINTLAAELRQRDIEVNLLHFPQEAIWPENRPHIVHHHLFYRDHQQYLRRAYQFAMKADRLGPARLQKALENLLGRRTSVHNAIDNALLPWLLEHSWLYGRVWILHKLTRHIPYLRYYTGALVAPSEFEHDSIHLSRGRTKSSEGPVEVRCRHARRADHERENFRQRFSGLAPGRKRLRNRMVKDSACGERGITTPSTRNAAISRRNTWPSRKKRAGRYCIVPRRGKFPRMIMTWTAATPSTCRVPCAGIRIRTASWSAQSCPGFTFPLPYR